MRYKAPIILFVLLLSFYKPVSCQTALLHNYEVGNVAKTGSKVLKGLLARADIENDTSFKWFKENMKLGQADVAALSAFGKNSSKFQIVVFARTWCDDSQNLLPVFYRLVEKSGYPDSSITLIGVDRPKTTLYNLHNAFHITDIPTFIVMKDGKEIGRVVEYGKYGQIDKELGEIVSSIQ
jgi:thiol-disulfide isomerase/thioredoxin